MFKEWDKVNFRGQSGIVSRLPSEECPYWVITTPENWFLLDGSEMQKVSGVEDSPARVHKPVDNY